MQTMQYQQQEAYYSKRSSLNSILIVILAILAAVTIAALVIAIVALARTHDHEEVLLTPPPAARTQQWSSRTTRAAAPGAAKMKTCPNGKAPCMYTSNYLTMISEEADNFINTCMGDTLYVYGVYSYADWEPSQLDLSPGTPSHMRCRAICQNVTSLYAIINGTKSNANLMEKVTASFVNAECKLWLGLDDVGFASTYYGDLSWGWTFDVLQSSGEAAMTLLGQCPELGTPEEKSAWIAKALSFMSIMPGRVAHRKTELMARLLANHLDSRLVAQRYRDNAYSPPDMFAEYCLSVEVAPFVDPYRLLCAQVSAISPESTATCDAYLTSLGTSCHDLVNYMDITWIPACTSGRGDNAPGLCGTTDGEKAYMAWWNFHESETKLSAADLTTTMNLGLAHSTNTLNAIVTKLGVANVSMAAAMMADVNDPNFYITGTLDVVVPEVQAMCGEIMSNLANSMLDYIPFIPPCTTTLYVNPALGFTGTSAGGYDYSSGSYIYPTWIQVSADAIANDTIYSYLRYSAPSLMAHEWQPGHGIQYVSTGMVIGTPGPIWFTGMTVYIEGWALYAEELAGNFLNTDGTPFYDTVYKQVGALSSVLERQERVYLDIALETNELTVQEAVQVLVDAGFTLDYAESQVLRYLMMVGQAPAYYLGKMQFIFYHEKYKTLFESCTECGNFFPEREFNKICNMMDSASWTTFDAVLNTWYQMARGNCEAKSMTGYCLLQENLWNPTMPSACYAGAARTDAYCLKK